MHTTRVSKRANNTAGRRSGMLVMTGCLMAGMLHGQDDRPMLVRAKPTRFSLAGRWMCRKIHLP